GPDPGSRRTENAESGFKIRRSWTLCSRPAGRLAPLSLLPLPYASPYDSKERTRLGRLTRREPAAGLAIPPAELLAQVLPLVRQLPRGLDELSPGARASHLRPIECVAAARSLRMDDEEVGVDPGDRVSFLAKPRELRVVLVASRPIQQHLARKKGLAPKRGESGCVEISRMD